MTAKVLGYGALQAKAKLAPYHFERRAPRVDDVVIEILYCGVCHSDLHHVYGDWATRYPIVPGHEIIGRVTQVGDNVTKFKSGDLVGVGCMVDSCQHCEPCDHGLEQYCEEGNTLTYNSLDRHDHMPTFGGYSENIIVSDKFVLKIPQNMELSSAAPLLCAGITTWSPLKHWKVNQNSRVAVVGLGGLGHMAIKLAKGLGAEVTLFTRSKGKEQDAVRLGADHVILSTDENQMQSAKNRFDLIIDTVPSIHDLNPYIPTLTLDGTIVLVGYLGDLNPFLNTAPMVMGRKSVAGSLIGGIAETQEMLDFCAKHHITSDVEMIDIQYIDKAYERMLKSDVKYRFVIDMASLKKDK
ncbi:NAD(P)-dependent alcohol dehydrogenase [Orbus wheelerorum]|uniref:NAD(P)-dependent alcohol dehydrogenase n=1 Tax=Orbus wheelerorum TaxID=3074111 RepID=UPI00370D3752